MKSPALVRIVVAATLCTVFAAQGQAQFPQRGPARTGSLLDVFRADYGVAELQLTDEQQAAIDDLLDSGSSFGAFANQIAANAGERADGEDRSTLAERIRQAGDEANAKINAQIEEILDETQFARLKQLFLHQIGPQAIARPDVAAALGIDEEQQQQLDNLAADQLRQRLPFNATQERREQFQDAWNARWLAVMTDAQREAWSKLLGDPPLIEEPTASDPNLVAQAQPETDPAQPIPMPMPQTLPPMLEDGASASFAPKGTTSAAPVGGPLSFNFDKAPWGVVIDLYAKAAGHVLHIRELPPGSFTYQDHNTYDLVEALDVINGYLLQEGYMLIRRDNALVSLNIDNDIPPNLIEQISPDEIESRGKNMLLSCVFPLGGIDVETVADEIDQIKGPQGTVVGLTSANSLYVADTGMNLRRIKILLDAAMKLGGPQDLVFRAYQLENIAAEDAEWIVRDMLGASVAVANVSAGSGSDNDSRDPRVRFFGGGDRNERDRRQQEEETKIPDPQITSDARTNKMLVSATTAQHLMVEELLKTVDVDEASVRQYARMGSRRPYLVVYTVKEADAREVTKTIDAIIPGVVINEDGRNDMIHILATEAQHEEVAALIRKLDGGAGGDTVAAIPLSTMDPLTAAATLRAMYIRDGDTAPIIEADLNGRQLLFRGNADQLIQVRSLLADLGEDGTGARRQTGLLRAMPLSGRSAAELVPLLQQLWNANNPGTPLNIYTPNDSGPVQDIRRPGERRAPIRGERGEEEGRDAVQAPEAQPAGLLSQALAQALPMRSSLVEVGFLQVVDEETADEPAAENSQPNAENESNDLVPPTGADPTQPGVSITVVGDQLLIAGSDTEAVNKLQDLYEELMTQMPPRTSWTIFTLQSADVTEAASMLEVLLPDSTISTVTSSTDSGGLFGGISQFGSSLASATGLSSLGASSLTIVPDVRVNAMWVSGPPSRVAEVEQLLSVIDQQDWPDTLRDRQPRMIPIEHAEVADVYDMVTDTYADLLQAPQMGGRGGNQALQMFLGGRGGGNNGGGGNNAAQATQLTISADTRTNHLIVSANDSLFEEIREFVTSIDTAALEAKRTVQVLPLQYASPTLIQNAMGSLMPRVTVNRVSSNAGNNSRGDDGRGGNDNNNNGDDAAARMERFRQMMQQRGGDSSGGNPFSRGGDNGGFRGFGGDRGSFGGDRGSSFRGFGGGDRGSFRGFGGDRGRD